MFIRLSEYFKNHSHAILGTIAIVQNLHILKGSVGHLLDAIAMGVAALGGGN